jgi:transposase
MWICIQPLTPAHPPRPNGGRPHVDDFRCFKENVSQLRNAIRCNDMTAEVPSGASCWRRFDAWNWVGVWPRVHQILV